jgi:hypothetical protein
MLYIICLALLLLLITSFVVLQCNATAAEVPKILEAVVGVEVSTEVGRSKGL